MLLSVQPAGGSRGMKDTLGGCRWHAKLHMSLCFLSRAGGDQQTCQQPACLACRLQGASREMDEAKVEARQTAMQNMRLKDDTARATQNSQDLLVENARSVWLLDTEYLSTRLICQSTTRGQCCVSQVTQHGCLPHAPACPCGHNRTEQRASHSAAPASAATACAAPMHSPLS